MSSKGDEISLPRGVYVPPTSSSGSDASSKKQQHDGYVRIPAGKGRNTCGFSRPIGTITETITVASKKRSHSLIAKDVDCIIGGIVTDQDATTEGDPTTNNETIQQKRTITEERLHPEEALFLHMRGLLRIEYNHETMSTQDLFCNMLPECKILLAAYLAYAHLRAQGYILIRYSNERIKLLLAQQLHPRAKDTSSIVEGENNHDYNPAVSESTEIQWSSNNNRRQAKQRLSDDVATAPPPSVVTFDGESNRNSSQDFQTRLAYFAYNPNSNFRRSNPGLPDFGVAIMPFHSSGVSAPSFATISALVALCEGKHNDGGDETNNADTAPSNEIPLRIATVSDDGAVIVYGVTRGDVPVIGKRKSEK
ncbi:hypothetical protein ACHAXM_010670 [Skeletonema potamos]|jgi:hypothetical protein